MYHLFPNVQFLADSNTATLIRMYPDENNPGRSITRVTFYYSEEAIQAVEAQQAAGVESGNVYDRDGREDAIGGIEALLEVFHSTIEKEDYAMGEMQQRAAETGIAVPSSWANIDIRNSSTAQRYVAQCRSLRIFPLIPLVLSTNGATWF